MVHYEITETAITIFDSHRVGKFRMMGELRRLRSFNPGHIVWERCLSSLYLEWICHNFLYMVGYERERTKDVDLDNPCDQPEWLYIVGGMIVWPFTFKTK